MVEVAANKDSTVAPPKLMPLSNTSNLICLRPLSESSDTTTATLAESRRPTTCDAAHSNTLVRMNCRFGMSMHTISGTGGTKYNRQRGSCVAGLACATTMSSNLATTSATAEYSCVGSAWLTMFPSRNLINIIMSFT
jgi:hypothetical protein